MNVEHLWFSNKEQAAQEIEEKEKTRHMPSGNNSCSSHELSFPLDSGELSCGGASSSGTEDSVRNSEDTFRTLTMMADQRLYKLVKWCKSLPLFKNILVCIIC